MAGEKNKGADFLSREGIFSVRKRVDENSIQMEHEKYLHPGTIKLFKTIQNEYKNDKLRNTCNKVVKNCEKCQKEKNLKSTRKVNKRNLHAMSTGESICIDIYGPISEKFLEEDVKYKYVLTILDRHSRYMVLIPLSNIESDTVTEKIVKEWITKIGITKDILSD